MEKLQNKIIVFLFFLLLHNFWSIFHHVPENVAKNISFLFSSFFVERENFVEIKERILLLSFPKILIYFEEFLPSKCVEFWNLMKRWVEYWLCSGSNPTKFSKLFFHIIFFFTKFSRDFLLNFLTKKKRANNKLIFPTKKKLREKCTQ